MVEVQKNTKGWLCNCGTRKACPNEAVAEVIAGHDVLWLCADHYHELLMKLDKKYKKLVV